MTFSRPWPWNNGQIIPVSPMCAQDQAIALLYDFCARLKVEGAPLYAIEAELIRPMESISILRTYAEAKEKEKERRC